MRKISSAKYASALAVACVYLTSSGYSAVSSSDLAIVGIDLTDDFFSVIALDDIAAGEVLYFTDSGWTGSSFTGDEGLIQFVVQPGGISAGTVLTVDRMNLGTGFTVVPGASDFSAGGANVSLQTSGDQLYIFQDSNLNDGSVDTPLWAVTLDASVWFYSGSSSTTESELYPGLTEGVNALALGLNSTTLNEGARFVLPGSYGGTFSGTADQLRALIQDKANWETLIETSGLSDPEAWVSESVNNVTIVPEPGSLSMLFLGALGATFYRRRKI